MTTSFLEQQLDDCPVARQRETCGAMFDAIVIGPGPNGLVARNRLADAGWSVQVVEAAPEPGGAVGRRS